MESISERHPVAEIVDVFGVHPSRFGGDHDASGCVAQPVTVKDVLRIYPEVHVWAEEEMTEPGSKREAQGLNIHIISV